MWAQNLFLPSIGWVTWVKLLSLDLTKMMVAVSPGQGGCVVYVRWDIGVVQGTSGPS